VVVLVVVLVVELVLVLVLMLVLVSVVLRVTYNLQFHVRKHEHKFNLHNCSKIITTVACSCPSHWRGYIKHVRPAWLRREY